MLGINNHAKVNKNYFEFIESIKLNTCMDRYCYDMLDRHYNNNKNVMDL